MEMPNMFDKPVDHLEPLHGLPNMHNAEESANLRENAMAMPSAWPNSMADHHVMSGASSAVSWSAVFAGATVAAALSLILLLLGTGLGLSAISPWSQTWSQTSSQTGISMMTLGISAIIWLAVTQIIAYGMGGYLAGRLRTKWLSVHTHEVYFRDTAHGFLVWAVASIATAVLLTSVISAIISGGMQAGSAVVTGGATDSNMNISETYLLNGLFRKDPNADTADINTQNSDLITSNNGVTSGGSSPSEVANIMFNTLRTGNLPDADVKYVGHIVAMRTGLNQDVAEQRVVDTFKNIQANMVEYEKVAKQTAEKARKASAYAALWLFISLLIGAFSASWAATFGGRCRDT